MAEMMPGPGQPQQGLPQQNGGQQQGLPANIPPELLMAVIAALHNQSQNGQQAVAPQSGADAGTQSIQSLLPGLLSQLVQNPQQAAQQQAQQKQSQGINLGALLQQFGVRL